jgi:predicted RNA-binding Zn-ribbon protein involved in translation (DUF1610 family)
MSWASSSLITSQKDDLSIWSNIEGDAIRLPFEIKKLFQFHGETENGYCLDGMSYEMYLTDKRFIVRSPLIVGIFSETPKEKPGKATIGDIHYKDISTIGITRNKIDQGLFGMLLMSSHDIYDFLVTVLYVGKDNIRDLLHIILERRVQHLTGTIESEPLVDAIRFTVSNYESVALNGASDGETRHLRFCPFPIIEIEPDDESGDAIVDTELTDIKAYKNAGVSIMLTEFPASESFTYDAKVEVPVTPNAGIVSEAPIRCRKCGKSLQGLPKKARFCPKCGTDIYSDRGAAIAKAPHYEVSVGTITILTGSMKGASLSIKDGETINLGKDKNLAHFIFPGDYNLVSRIHCTVTFSARHKKYYVTDCSSNGTYRENRVKLEKGKRTAVEPNSVILLADEWCSVLLK